MAEPDRRAAHGVRHRPWVTTSSLPTDAGSPVKRVGLAPIRLFGQLFFDNPSNRPSTKSNALAAFDGAVASGLRRTTLEQRGAQRASQPRRQGETARARACVSHAQARSLGFITHVSVIRALTATGKRRSLQCAAAILSADTSPFAACDARSTKTPRPVSQGACESSDTRLLNARFAPSRPFDNRRHSPFVPLYKPRQCLRLRYSAAIVDAC